MINASVRGPRRRLDAGRARAGRRLNSRRQPRAVRIMTPQAGRPPAGAGAAHAKQWYQAEGRDTRAHPPAPSNPIHSTTPVSALAAMLAQPCVAKISDQGGNSTRRRCQKLFPAMIKHSGGLGRRRFPFLFIARSRAITDAGDPPGNQWTQRTVPCPQGWRSPWTSGTGGTSTQSQKEPVG